MTTREPDRDLNEIDPAYIVQSNVQIGRFLLCHYRNSFGNDVPFVIDQDTGKRLGLAEHIGSNPILAGLIDTPEQTVRDVLESARQRIDRALS